MALKSSPIGTPEKFEGLKAGELRNLITIQQRLNLPQDAAGQLTSTWIDFATIKAAIYPVDGRELDVAGRIVEEIDYEVRIWYVEGLDHTMKIKAGWGRNSLGPEMDIKTALTYKTRYRWMRLLCKSGVPEA